MNVFQAAVLGLTQGLTEFLPISSSAHLTFVNWAFGWGEPSLAFDAALHLGTLVAVFAYFWRDLLNMLLAVPTALLHPKQVLTPPELDAAGEPVYNLPRERDARLAILLVIGSIPAGVAGFLLQDRIDAFFYSGGHEDRAIAVSAILLIVFGLVLGLADRNASLTRRLQDLVPTDAIGIGVAQALALFPGVSRSGITISSGLFRGLKREDAARFAFLLGIPLILVASLSGLKDLADSQLTSSEWTAVGVGLLVSMLSGFAAIWWMLRYLQRATTRVFVVYRVVLGTIILVVLAIGLR